MEKYDAVRNELGWDGGETGDWDKFFGERLRPAFEKVGDTPQPDVSTVEVHASYPV